MHILEYKINNTLNHSDLQPTQFPSTLEAHLAQLLHNSLELLAAAVHEGADEFDCVCRDMPASPEMKWARNLLDCLLNGMLTVDSPGARLVYCTGWLYHCHH